MNAHSLATTPLRRLLAVVGSILIAGAAASFAAGGGGADEPSAGGGAGAGGGGAGPSADKIAITTATLIPTGGSEIPYTAATGYMPLKDESGKLRARIFYVAYTAGATSTSQPATEKASGVASTTQSNTQPATQDSALKTQDSLPGLGSKRPLIFLFNGGPGAASVWLHLGAVGPRRLDIPADGSAPKAPYQTIDNPSSWLAAADLVFVDPVDTGYSRPADPEKAKEFFGTQEDISYLADFIRLYVTRHQRWAAPIFLAGESYGTTRVAGLAPYLQEHTGISVNGIILVSAVLNFADLSPGDGNDLPYPLFLPTYAAVASYHNKANAGHQPLETFLKDVEAFAENQYTVALAKGAALPDSEKQSIAKKIAAYTGLTEKYILDSNLRIPPQRFQKELLRGDNKILGRFDARLTGDATDPVNASVEYDPSLSGFYPAYASAFNDYVRRTLKYENDLPYEVLSGRTRPWNFSAHGGSGGMGYLYVGDNLRDAMTQNPHLKLMICCGRYDLATPYFSNDYTVNHLNLPAPLQKNITRTYYPGGHMLYHVRENLESLHKDVTTFLNTAK